MVTLRPLREADLKPLAVHERDEAPSPFDDFGFRGPGSLKRALELDGGLPTDGQRGRLAVTVNGTIAGSVSWHTVPYGPNEASNALNVGVVLLDGHRGQGIGPKALHALARYLFAHFAVNRVEASTDVENGPAQKALERAGFTREGVLRGAQFRLGRWHDMYMYAVVRGDLKAVEPSAPGRT